MLRTFAEWRRPGSTCRGGLVWFARDLSPGAGWGIIDASGRPKSVYWYLKRAWLPVTLVATDEGLNGLWLHALNDTPTPVDAELRVALYLDGTMRGRPAHKTLRIPGGSSTSIHADEMFGAFLDLTRAYRFGAPGHDVVAATLRDPATATLLGSCYYFPGTLPATCPTDLGLTARIEPMGGEYSLVLETKRFAHAVGIELDDFLPRRQLCLCRAGRNPPRRPDGHASGRQPARARVCAQRVWNCAHRRERGRACTVTIPRRRRQFRSSSRVRSRATAHFSPGTMRRRPRFAGGPASSFARRSATSTCLRTGRCASWRNGWRARLRHVACRL